MKAEISVFDGVKTVEVISRRTLSGFQVFCHKPSMDTGFAISELSTGCRIGNPRKTEQEAWKQAKEKSALIPKAVETVTATLKQQRRPAVRGEYFEDEVKP